MTSSYNDNDIPQDEEIPFERVEDLDEELEEQKLYHDYADILEDDEGIEEE
jgi:hypothetical protein